MAQAGKTFRIFVSSTFSDLKEERNALQKYVFPRLRELCMQHGCRFQAIDLRWGVSEEASLDQQTVKICLQEIKRCQKTTPRPNFVVLLGDRYGWRPLPAEIPAAEYEEIKRRAANTDDQALLKAWYRRDDNAVPPVYCLQARTGDSRDYARWQEVERRLHTVLVQSTARMTLDVGERVKYTASATEQEIVCGALNVPDAQEHVFCYFRQITNRDDLITELPRSVSARDFLDLDESVRPDPEAFARQGQLRQRLRDSLPGNIHDYAAEWRADGITIDHIGTLPETLEDCLKLIDDDNAGSSLCVDVWRRLARVILDEVRKIESVDPLDKEIEDHKNFGQERAKFFTGRAGILQTISDYVKGTDPHPLAVFGDSGSGKTALMAHAIADCERHSASNWMAECVIVSRFIGATPNSSDGRALLEGLCRQISGRCGADEAGVPVEYQKLVEELPQRLALATSGKPLVVFIDALDQLSDFEHARNLNWLPRDLPAHVRLIVSTLLPGEGLPQLERKLPAANLVKLEPMPKDEGSKLLDLWLEEAGRTLQDDQQAEVLSKFAANGLPLYLKLAFEEARRWKSYSLPTPLGTDIPGIVREMFRRLSADHGQMLVSRSLGYLAAAKNGLSEDELLDVLSRSYTVFKDFLRRAHQRPPAQRLPVIVWSRLYFDLEAYLTERSADETSLLAFYHRQFGKVVAEDYLADDGKRECHRGLACYFRAQANEEDWSGPARSLKELPFHLAGCAQWPELEELLLAIPYLDARCNHGDVRSLLADFDRLAAPDEAIRELKEFIFTHAQRLEAKRDILFGLIQHEGPPTARHRSEALLLSNQWKKPWLRATPVQLPVSVACEDGMNISVVAQYSFERSGATSMAETLGVAFYLKRLGHIGIIDTHSMRELPETIVIPAQRVLGLFASAHGRFLAAAFESGDLSVLELEFSGDRALLGQQEVAYYRYLVPETEPPTMQWNEKQLLFQRQDGNLAILENTLEKIITLPPNCYGELSGVVFTHGEWVVSIRQASDTWIWRCGSDDKLAIPAADVISAGCSQDGVLVMGLSDQTLRVFQTTPALRQSGLLETEELPVCVGAWHGGIMWANQEGLRYWDSIQSIVRPLVDDKMLSTLYLRVNHLSIGPQGHLFVLGDHRVCQIELTAATQTASYSVDEALMDAGGAVYAIQKRDKDLWLVDCAEQNELCLARNAIARHFHALDGHGHLLTIAASGGGVLTDLTSHLARRVQGPLALNSVVVNRGTFWLADRFGGIYRLTENYALILEGKVTQQDVGGGRLSALADGIVWQGKSTAVTVDNPYADPQDCLLFFSPSKDPFHLREVGLRSFNKADGRLQILVAGEERKELVAIFHGHSEFALCAKIGTPDEFLRHKERTVPMDFDSSVIDCVLHTEDNALYLCSGDHDLIVIDLETLQTRCRLTVSRPFTALAGNGHQGVVAVEAGKRLYQCRMEVPSHAETV